MRDEIATEDTEDTEEALYAEGVFGGFGVFGGCRSIFRSSGCRADPPRDGYGFFFFDSPGAGVGGAVTFSKRVLSTNEHDDWSAPQCGQGLLGGSRS